mmetsp:Transcript_1408/g.2584  ORF Transcript_1408/g.2584 Transcript_1408/m.2584 type:complete len:131 (+) Transcript_1408:471-863(+)
MNSTGVTWNAKNRAKKGGRTLCLIPGTRLVQAKVVLPLVVALPVRAAALVEPRGLLLPLPLWLVKKWRAMGKTVKVPHLLLYFSNDDGEEAKRFFFFFPSLLLLLLSFLLVLLLLLNTTTSLNNRIDFLI